MGCLNQRLFVCDALFVRFVRLVLNSKHSATPSDDKRERPTSYIEISDRGTFPRHIFMITSGILLPASLYFLTSVSVYFF